MNSGVARTNMILGALSLPDFHAIQDDIKLVDLAQRDVIYEPGNLIERVYFPLDCVLSLITVMENGDSVEVSVVGREGFSAPQLVFGSRVPVSEMICQVPGQAMVMHADKFRSYVEAMPAFKELVFAYMESLFNFMGQSIACNRLHTLIERFARWLLATHDRVARDEFHLTQEFLAIMLGVARTAVTGAAGTLQDNGLISFNRGVITIVDRERLEAASCECYAVMTKGLNMALSAKIS